jgi:hypothetical protein
VRLEQLRTALLKSGSDDDWWKALLHFCTQEGCVRLEWIGGGHTRKQIIASRPVVWSFQIPLGDGESVEVKGDLKHDRNSFDLMAFSEVLRKTFPGNRREHKPLALS